MNDFTPEQKEIMERYKKPFIDEINRSDIIKVLNLTKAKHSGYVCPICHSGEGHKGTGLEVTADHRRVTCFANTSCPLNGGGRGQDVYESLKAVTGKSGNEILKENFSNYDIRKAFENSHIERPQLQSEEKTIEMPTESNVDYTEYYRLCLKRLEEPKALEYLSFRGISVETAVQYQLGYDPAADPASTPGAISNEYKPHPCPRLIIPFDKSHYMGRSIDSDTDKVYAKINNKKIDGNDSIPPFNLNGLYNADKRPVFITEGAIDALSIIEAGGVAVGLNSVSNWRRIIECLENKSTESIIILCLDNDVAGKRANNELVEGLKKLNVQYNEVDICGEYKDPNEYLTSNRAAFIEKVAIAEKNSLFPGLLTPERAIKIFESVDDHFLDLPRFPTFSKISKLKTHDTVVIAADTGAGKSSLALNILYDLQDKYPSLYFNLEMDEATILQRLVSIHTGVELDIIEGYKHDQRTRDNVNAAMREILSRREIQLLQDVYDIESIENQIKIATKGRKEPTMVFVDTGLLVKMSGKTTSRYERFTQISEELRRISRLNNVIMFVLLQQSRDGKKEEKKGPTNSSLKESGSWENDATKIIFLWRNPISNKKEIVITKNRSGKTGSIEVEYFPHTQTYKEDKQRNMFVPDDESNPFLEGKAARTI